MSAQRLRERYGPWAVVTGASDGIGRTFAEALGRAGVDLVLVARREAALEDVARAIRQRDGVEVIVHAADLARPAGIEGLIDALATREIGLLVAAAGASIRPSIPAGRARSAAWTITSTPSRWRIARATSSSAASRRAT
ncbi:MAG: SDR family NAD(P)-dependent oxidoreductase, partial [Acidobacteriota bacterium]